MATGIVASVMLLSTLQGPLVRPTIASASSTLPELKAKNLALPRSTFPAKSAVHGATVSNATANQLSGLHVISLNKLGRSRDYAQSAEWSWSSPSANSFNIQYLASVYQSTDDATRAFGDGQASLWEVGQRITGPTGPLVVYERNGLIDSYYLFHQGLIESELRLRYSPHSRADAIRAAFWYFQHSISMARRKAQKISGAATLSAPPGALPEIYTAPPGTGPVVKSPSLMTSSYPPVSRSGSRTTIQQPAASLSDAGLFRTFSKPPLVSRVIGQASLVPPKSLARFTRTVTINGGTAWYESSSLYSSTSLAETALRSLRISNNARKSLKLLRLSPTVWKAGRLGILDASSGWKLGDESIFTFRKDNVLLMLATVAQNPSPVGLAKGMAATIPTWLHARGTDIVDAADQPVTLNGLNWYGAEQSDFVVGGLDYEPYQAILQTIRILGYNAIRLPFSNELVEKDPIVVGHLAANPELRGLHALQVLDRIINYAGSLGLSVILDNHRSEAGWSSEENGLWYTPAYPDTSWTADWSALAQRYSKNNVVIGADLRNEPHASATWGSGNAATDWLGAAERAGNAVLAQNPHLLVVVEGVQYYGTMPGYWWGGNLMGVATNPVLLRFKDGASAKSQLVYSAHDYGPDNCNGGCPWFNAGTSYDTLAQIWDQYWGYITQDPANQYASPVWVGEFGTCNYQASCVLSTVPGSQGQWFASLLRYIRDRHLSWAYWSVNGTESTAPPYRAYGALDWYGFLNQSWSGPILMLEQALQSIRSP